LDRQEDTGQSPTGKRKRFMHIADRYVAGPDKAVNNDQGMKQKSNQQQKVPGPLQIVSLEKKI
jgi:hypothetical protein